MEEVVLFLEFGCHSCSINIIVKNQIYFKRELAINGDSLTQAIAKHCNLSYEDAEGLKQTLGLIGADSSTQDIQTNEKEVMVNEALWLHLENLIQEIDYTFKYFVHQFTAGRISKFDRIILSGGSANLNRFSAYLNGYLSVPVEIADPLKGIPLSPEIISKSGNLAGLSPRLSVAAGLALRELV
jgi:type IV pilus assembly protein PilM